MSDNCINCPCPDICFRRKSFCEMASKENPSELELKHICSRSKIGTNKVVSSRIVISTGGGGMVTVPSSESIQLTKEMKSCKYYQKESNCGCGMSRCLAGKGKPDINNTGLVNVWDCYACLRPDNELYAKHSYKLPRS
jgi:hypothetical protein